ncbi:hypothetical protein G6O67_007691 [Ophiocordyceps sinensis]|uniref:Rhodopsin domain-containing protein n=1 Tax=Ophiocordyceps sinensis TaxID=72228 RepID=A0A8H4PLG5_9HYPO|nr:hypothetical protein G6O67_007691 [Ophiocordyceps sinensis]
MSASPTASGPPDSGDPGRGPMLIAVRWVFTSLSIIFVGLRFYSRRRKRLGYGWDDWLMLMVVTVRVALSAQVPVLLQYGYGRHDRDMTPEQQVQVLKASWLTMPESVFVSAVARISIAILLVRLFGVHSWFKWFCIAVTALQAVLAVIFVPLTFLQKRPVEALWEIRMPHTVNVDPHAWLIIACFLQSLWSFSDLTFVLFPVIIVWRLRMPPLQKLGIIVVMCMSLFAMAMSILKTVFMTMAPTGGPKADLQYDAALHSLYAALELDLVIIMGCIPPLRSMLVAALGRLGAMGTSLRSLLGNDRKQSGGNDRKQSGGDDDATLAHDVEFNAKGRLGGDARACGSETSELHLVEKGYDRRDPVNASG